MAAPSDQYDETLIIPEDTIPEDMPEDFSDQHESNRDRQNEAYNDNQLN